MPPYDRDARPWEARKPPNTADDPKWREINKPRHAGVPPGDRRVVNNKRNAPEFNDAGGMDREAEFADRRGGFYKQPDSNLPRRMRNNFEEVDNEGYRKNKVYREPRGVYGQNNGYRDRNSINFKENLDEKFGWKSNADVGLRQVNLAGEKHYGDPNVYDDSLAGRRNVIDRHALGVVDDDNTRRLGQESQGYNTRVQRSVDDANLQPGLIPEAAASANPPSSDEARRSAAVGEIKVNETAEFIKYFQGHLKTAEILRGKSYNTEYELIPFNRFVFNRIFMVDPGLGKRVVEKPIGSKKKDINEILFHAIDNLNKNRSKSDLYTQDDFVEGIYRTDPTSGTHYEMYFNNRDKNSVNRGHAYVKVSVLRPFAPPITLQQSRVDTSSEWINIILPLSGRVETFRLFMDQFISVCIKHDRRIYLTVVYFGVEGLKEVKSIMSNVAKTHKFKLMKLVTLNETFARGRGLQIGALNWKGGDALLFFCDVDIVFTTEFLERCRLNTEKGQRVYYPIVFSLYNPRIVYSLQDVPVPSFHEQLVLSKDTGFWRDFGYGMTCQYRSDFLKIKGFDEQITGWGGEDVLLYQKFVRSDYFVIRSTDPAIFHLWHEKVCEPTLSPEQYRSCIRSKALNEASHPQLGLLAFKDEIDVHRSVSEKNVISMRASSIAKHTQAMSARIDERGKDFRMKQGEMLGQGEVLRQVEIGQQGEAILSRQEDLGRNLHVKPNRDIKSIRETVSTENHQKKK